MDREETRMARRTAPWLTLGLLAGAASRRVLEAGQSSAFHLIETLAAHLGRVILDEFPESVRAVIASSRDRP
jgi:hypothetical protein